jgi:DNA-binding transcriptional regulator YiaG
VAGPGAAGDKECGGKTNQNIGWGTNRMDGRDVKVLRKQLGLTQEEFAHEIGVTFATVNRWENHKSKPSRLALRVLAETQESVAPPKRATRKKKATRRAPASKKKATRRRR